MQPVTILGASGVGVGASEVWTGVGEVVRCTIRPDRARQGQRSPRQCGTRRVPGARCGQDHQPVATVVVAPAVNGRPGTRNGCLPTAVSARPLSVRSPSSPRPSPPLSPRPAPAAPPATTPAPPATTDPAARPSRTRRAQPPGRGGRRPGSPRARRAAARIRSGSGRRPGARSRLGPPAGPGTKPTSGARHEDRGLRRATFEHGIDPRGLVRSDVHPGASMSDGVGAGNGARWLGCRTAHRRRRPMARPSRSAAPVTIPAA